ncbi:MAG: tRNA uridine-5-carboxymethylaminomethyl(34) synthesis GTPase MnmE [Ruminococcaceae bacterium]|nr:tRNA uridine-5-carboxymethylaminomethyl(34) synthesis GTPase MnmE [Oscillospiraceae bacterium]
MKQYFEDTIAAISTMSGGGSIGIIRISGIDAITIADKIFVNKKRATGTVARMSTHTVKYGFIIDKDKDQIIDECLLTLMKGPNSYTTEDVVEINCHGGYAVMQSVLKLVYKNGARPAEPGEFTKRAFLNGRIALSGAEAVMDLINAKTSQAHKAAINQLSGRLDRELNEICEKLGLCLAQIEVAIDYPEYEMEEDTARQALETLESIETKLCSMAATYSRGKIIKDGFKIAIAGKPNAGKSSLLNVLCGSDRAIVTDIPGTTRDIIDVTIDVDGIPIIITDTAGLRETEDIVEKIGVDRSYNAISDSDLMLYVIDASCNSKDENESLSNLIKEYNIPVMVIINKTDLVDNETLENYVKEFSQYDPLTVSILSNSGIESIYDRFRKIFTEKGVYLNNENIITSERHKQLLDNSIDAISKAKESYKSGMPIDCISYDIWECGKFLEKITGKSIEADVVETIFSKFCLGK